MARIGVITCQILELEFAHILSADPDVSDIRVVNDAYSQELLPKLENAARKTVYRLAAVEEGFADQEHNGFGVLVQVLEVGLHSNIPALTHGVTTAVAGMAPFVDAVILGYGLCGNALDRAEELFKGIHVPVLLPMDGEHPVDDCVGLMIGGRENYYAEQCRCAGTMFMNSGFSRHWKKILSPALPEKLASRRDRIMRRLMENYQRSLLLPTCVLGESELRDNTREFNERYELRTDTRPGTLALLEGAWQAVKRAAREAVDRQQNL